MSVFGDHSNILFLFRTSHVTITESVQSVDFWRTELDNIIRRIRRDFEVFYGKIQSEMIAYYEAKTNEIETNIQQAYNYQQTEVHQWSATEERLTVEYEQIEQSLAYERSILVKLEDSYCKFGFLCTQKEVFEYTIESVSVAVRPTVYTIIS